jgi:hypothetical protein
MHIKPAYGRKIAEAFKAYSASVTFELIKPPIGSFLRKSYVSIE